MNKQIATISACVLALSAAAFAQTLDGIFVGRNTTTNTLYSDQVFASPGDQIQIQWSFPNGVACSGSWTTLQLPCSGNTTFPAPTQSTAISFTAAAGNITTVKSLQIILQGQSIRPSFSFSGLRNGFSFANGPLAPNTIMSIFGTGLATGETTAPPNNFPLSLGTTQVAINGTFVPLLYAARGQVNFLVPPLIPGQVATMTVYNNGAASDAVVLPVHDYLPGLASLGGSVIALDAGSFVPITADNPIASGKPADVALFGTGFGLPINNKLSGVLSVLVDDHLIDVQYAGPAPGLLGLSQINFRVTLASGPHPTVVFYEGRLVGNFTLNAK